VLCVPLKVRTRGFLFGVNAYFAVMVLKRGNTADADGFAFACRLPIGKAGRVVKRAVRVRMGL
jgi:hypothetical protein